jgi:hypothetical protein
MMYRPPRDTSLALILNFWPISAPMSNSILLSVNGSITQRYHPERPARCPGTWGAVVLVPAAPWRHPEGAFAVRLLARPAWRRPDHTKVVTMAAIRMTGGEALAAQLSREGVSTVFGVPGIQLEPTARSGPALGTVRAAAHSRSRLLWAWKRLWF